MICMSGLKHAIWVPLFARVQKAPGTRAHSEEPWVIKSHQVEGDRAERGRKDRVVLPPRSVEVLQQEGRVSAEDAIEQLGTAVNVEAPQPKVAKVGEKVHQLPEPKPTEAASDEGAGATMSCAMLSVPVPDVMGSSSQPI